MTETTTLRPESTLPERRRVVLVVLGINTVFLAVELASFGFSPLVLGGRVLLSASLLHAWWLTGRRPTSPRLSWWFALHGALLTSGLGLVAAGTGGGASPYAFFVPVVPIVLGIAAPDEEVAPLTAGLASLLSGLLILPAAAPGQVVFLVAANGSCAFYGWVAARLYRRMRLREREAAESRERALEELRRSEVRRAGAERLAALGRLAAGVAHEINNPLAFVNSNVGFALRELAGLEGIEPDVLQALQDSQGGLERMKRIVVELRGFSRDSADGPGPTEILPAIETARRTLAARLAAVAPLEVEAAPDLPLVVAHRGELVQVLVNLLGNALDAMEPAAVAGRPGLASIRVERAGGGLELAVDDAGPGFSEEALRHAFAPFFSTKGQGGTGLGLALSRELVERWGGRITAANRPGGGACVVIALRLAEAQEVTGAMAVGGAAPRGAQASDGVSSAASQGRSGAPG